MKKNSLTSPVVVTAIAMFCCLLWGSATPVIKLGYEILGIQSDDWAVQLLFAGIRFSLAGVLAVLFGSIVNKKFLYPRRPDFKHVLTLSAFQTVMQYFSFYIGVAHCAGAKSAIINSSNAFLTILLACFVFRQEKMTRRKAAGCLLGLLGLVIINLGGDWSGKMTFLGEGFLVVAALGYSVAAVLMHSFSTKSDPVMLAGWQFFFGGLVLCLVGVLFGGRLDLFRPACLLLLLYLGCLSAAAYSLWSILLKYNPVSKVSLNSVMVPVFGVFLSALILGETEAFSINTVVSLLLICGGIYIVNKKKHLPH